MNNELELQLSGLRDELREQATRRGAWVSASDLEAFALKMSGLEGLDYEQMLERLEGTTIPGGFRHVHVTNLNTGETLLDCSSVLDEAIPLDTILVHLSCVIEEEGVTESDGRGVWVETEILPFTNPGVLDLGIRFASLN